ncbi:MAG TPA: hypothetical protein VIY27_02290, partial [Myxococcota bacterium]
AWLYSQGLGVLCGQGTVLLLAVGSVALTATRDGASQAIGMDDIRGFFAAPSPVHLWFYLLIPLLTLYALNTTLATWRNVARRWSAGIRAPRFYAPAVIHSAFLVGLLAHAVGGLAGRELGVVSVGPGWAALGDGREARVVALDVETHADGTTKQIRAAVELRAPDGAVSLERVRYNGPLSGGLGRDLLLLMRPQAVAAARLVRGADHCDLEPGDSCRLADLRAQLLYLHPPISTEQGGFAQVRVRHAADGADQVLALRAGQPAALSDGSHLALAGIEPRPALLLRRRHAPGNPWALLASVLLVIGLAMMGRRFVPRSS